MADDEQSDLSTFDAGSDADSGADSDTNRGADGGAESGDANDSGDDSPGPAGDTDGSSPVGSVADLDKSERVELGVDLLAHVEAESLSLSEAVDRIETVTTNPALTREILDTAELRGVIERDEGRLRTRRGGTYVRFEQQVVEREGDYECRRCGASLSTGHFVQFQSGELGPFGPSCVRKVLGRE